MNDLTWVISNGGFAFKPGRFIYEVFGLYPRNTHVEAADAAANTARAVWHVNPSARIPRPLSQKGHEQVSLKGSCRGPGALRTPR